MPDRFFAQGCPSAGLVKKGNIDIYHRAVAHLPGGKIATVESFSIPIDETPRRNMVRIRGCQVLLASVVNGRVVSTNAAIQNFIRTGQNLGIFRKSGQATAYAICLHKQQEKFYRGR